MTNPYLISTPFSDSGDKQDILDSAPVDPNDPTWVAGFPTITSTPIGEGGLPPKRISFNGVLNAITQNTVHQSKGLMYEFDAAYAAKIGGYPLNSRLALSNGDIVVSTIPNNTNNPNTDMTGWKNISYIYDTKVVSILDFSPNADGVTNDTVAWDAAKAKSNAISLSNADFSIPLFRTPVDVSVINGQGATVKVDSNNGASVIAVQLIGGTQLSDVTFENAGVSLDGSRAVVSDNSYLKNVGFYNFVHSVAQPNAWGVYLKNNKNIVLDSCHFGNNSQSDIAILEGTENVTIINARNDSEDGVYLNLEPNNDVQVKNVNVIGGKFRFMSLLENSNLNYVIKGFTCTGADITTLRYRGAEANFNNCNIGSILANWVALDGTGAQVEYAGALRINNANLSANFITNPDLSDFTTNAASYWNITATNTAVDRVRKFDEDGAYWTLNDSKANTVTLFQRNKQPLSGLTQMCVAMRYRVNNNPTYLNYNVAQVRFYDVSNVEVGRTNIKGARGAGGSNSGWHTDIALLTIPEGATQYQLYLTVVPNSSMDVKEVGIYDLTLNSGNNFNAVLDQMSKPNKTISVSIATNYTVTTVTNVDITGVTGAKVGMSVKNIRSSLVLGNNSLLTGEVVSDGLVRIYHRNITATGTITQNQLLYLDVE